MITTFESPANGYRVQVSDRAAFCWTLLFGGLYFLARGSIRHFFIGLILGACTFGISWLIYPFLAANILRAMYYERGYREISTEPSPSLLPALAVILLLAGGAGYWFHFIRPNQQSSAEPTAATADSTDSLPAQPRPTPHPAVSARAEAVRLYPSLAQKDSPLNRSFLALYERTRTQDPNVLLRADWPLVLAEEAASSLGVSSPTASFSTPRPQQWRPAGTSLDKKPR
jgi:hypothetical protein